MTLRTTAALAAGLVALTTTGCEMMIPLMLAEGDESTGIPDYGAGDGWETTELEVELDTLELDLGTSTLDPALSVQGQLVGQSTFFEIQSELDQDVPVFITVELCPIDDVIDYGDVSSALRYVSVTAGDEARWADSYDMHVEVTESSNDLERTVHIDAVFPEGGHIDLTLRYTAPY